MLAWTKRIDLFVKGARIERHTNMSTAVHL